MYRIHFEPSVSAFVVQVLWMGMIWRTCRRTISGLAGEPSMSLPKLFDTYDMARSWVDSVGLSKAYREQQPYSQNQLVMGTGAR